MDYTIGIASYNRKDRQYTAEYLKRLGIPRDHIIISTQTIEDYKEYKAAGVDKLGELIYQDSQTAAGNRNTILNTVSSGKKVVLIDDDVLSVDRLINDKLEPIQNLDDFDEFINNGFISAARNKTIGFGVYPVNNAYFMSKKVRPRNICDAGLMGIVNTGLRFNTCFQSKEDYELCCRIIKKYGAFVRLDEYSLHCKSGHVGGCSEVYKDNIDWQRTAKALVAMYPDILRLNKKRPGEVSMKR